MTPKENAIELVKEFSALYGINKELVKDCSLISVNLLLNETNINGDERNYWIAVKQEIEKL